MRTDEEKIRQEITKLVTERQGCKATELAVVAVRCLINRIDARELDKIPDLIEQMVKEGELLEVEFVLPMMDWRCKSFLLPKGTEVKLSKGFVVQFGSLEEGDETA